MKKVFAIQRLDNGQVFDYCENPEQASYWLNMNNPRFELVPTNTSSIVVTYSELGGTSWIRSSRRVFHHLWRYYKMYN